MKMLELKNDTVLKD